MDAPQSLAVIRERAARVRTISGEGAITLTDERGQTVRLDGAFVFAPPDRARIRAWKFGQAVLDLTVIGDETWLFVPPRQTGRAEQLKSASSQTGRAIREWLALLARGIGDGENDESLMPPSVEGDDLIVSLRRDNGLIVCKIDRKTLTPRSYALIPEGGVKAAFMLTLSKYTTVGDAVWPTVIEANSLTGSVKIELRDLSRDDAPPPTAFKPPARAVKL